MLSFQMATKPLTSEAIALTEKKMDMSLGNVYVLHYPLLVSLNLPFGRSIIWLSCPPFFFWLQMTLLRCLKRVLPSLTRNKENWYGPLRFGLCHVIDVFWALSCAVFLILNCIVFEMLGCRLKIRDPSMVIKTSLWRYGNIWTQDLLLGGSVMKAFGFFWNYSRMPKLCYIFQILCQKQHADCFNFFLSIQGVLSQRRTNFQGNSFPSASEAARKVAMTHFHNRVANRTSAANWNRQR